jgi:hypothetical protein
MASKKRRSYKAQTKNIMRWEARQADFYRAQGFVIAVILIGLILWLIAAIT